jgi:SAM-dependent methyltransferase
MCPLSQIIERYHDQQAENEWERMDRHRTESAVTLRALTEHLAPPPARVLDCGSGPGRYAIELARRGYSVTVFDLSAEFLRLAQENAAEAGVALQGCEQGGASAALHGVPISVGGLELAMDTESAHRFQTRFGDHSVELVALRENRLYRSHFGRFEIDGVAVEVMDHLHRHEVGEWAPAATTTEARVDPEGVPVCVSWLEEEILAYIRRGRLERAAHFLPYCDPSRLSALLRRKQAS